MFVYQPTTHARARRPGRGTLERTSSSDAAVGTGSVGTIEPAESVFSTFQRFLLDSVVVRPTGVGSNGVRDDDDAR